MNYNFLILEDDVKKRLDVFLLEKLPQFTRSYLKTLIEKNNILCNGLNVKAGYKIKQGDKVEAVIPEPEIIDLRPENIDFEIVYEDYDLLVINKPQGLVVHPSSSTRNGTLVNALLYKINNLSSINGRIRPGIVHRLDKNTTGLMLVAKTDIAHHSLSKQISEKSCIRKYKAICIGSISKDEGTITTYIGRSNKDRKKMTVVKQVDGKVAISNYKVLKRFNNYTLLEFELKTGRTHQIRVHARHMGCPVLGDEIYGKRDSKFGLKGQCLHSYYIKFEHPTSHKIMEFKIGLPSDFQHVIDVIK